MSRMPELFTRHLQNQRANFGAATLISVISNKLPTTIFAAILLLFVPGFAILFQVERRAMRTSYLLVTHITLDDFPTLLSISINSEILPLKASVNCEKLIN